MPRDTLPGTAKQSAFAIIAGVGANKTRSAVAYIANNPQQSFIYCAPTVQLLEQTGGNIRKAVEGQGRAIHEVHTNTRGDSPTVREALLGVLNVALAEGDVVLCTSLSLIAVLPKIEHPERYSLLLDEAFAPVDFMSWHLGIEAERNWKLFTERFEVLDSGQIIPNFATLQETKRVLEGGISFTGQDSMSYRELAQAVFNDALHVEIVPNEAFERCKAGSAAEVEAEARARAEKNPDGADRIALRIAAYPTPDYFGRFKEFIFLAALFERSLFHAIWSNHFKVRFEKHPAFPDSSMRQLHTLQGPYVEIGHILPPGEHASKENLKAKIDGSEVKEGENAFGSRRIDQALKIASQHFGEESWVVSINGKLGFDGAQAEAKLLPKGARKVPTICHGLNRFKDVRHGAALAVTNPAPPEARWYKEKTGLTTEEVHHRHRLHTVYQTLGRTAVRAEDPDACTKKWLVWSRDEAEALLEIWKGSKDLGQVGSMKARKDLKGTQQGTQRITRGRNPGKTAEIAAAVLEALNGAAPMVSDMHLPTLKKKAAPGLHPMEWKRAVDAALRQAPGWTRRGHSAVR